MLRARGLPGVESLEFVRWRGKEGTLKLSDSAPDEAARETGLGRRIVKETLGVDVELDIELVR